MSQFNRNFILNSAWCHKVFFPPPSVYKRYDYIFTHKTIKKTNMKRCPVVCLTLSFCVVNNFKINCKTWRKKQQSLTVTVLQFRKINYFKQSFWLFKFFFCPWLLQGGPDMWNMTPHCQGGWVWSGPKRRSLCKTKQSVYLPWHTHICAAVWKSWSDYGNRESCLNGLPLSADKNTHWNANDMK